MSSAKTSRPLTPGEIALARRVFADDIDYRQVRIHARNYVFWQGAGYIITPNGQMYLGRRLRHYTDFSAAGIQIQAFFIHEMAHVWQHQHGVNVLCRGLGEQIRHFLGFNQYRYRLGSPASHSRPTSSNSRATSCATCSSRNLDSRRRMTPQHTSR
ncbi:hypothetical protein [Cupriavidus metallidurans]|uniref:hypothetical protein n=1 Tax=Cupriavidus metallidurans TaxID=119219 RepID=UPI000A74933E|nr:hypothetical protein [Cupriavidus metallidurans]